MDQNNSRGARQHVVPHGEIDFEPFERGVEMPRRRHDAVVNQPRSSEVSPARSDRSAPSKPSHAQLASPRTGDANRTRASRVRSSAELTTVLGADHDGAVAPRRLFSSNDDAQSGLALQPAKEGSTANTDADGDEHADEAQALREFLAKCAEYYGRHPQGADGGLALRSPHAGERGAPVGEDRRRDAPQVHDERRHDAASALQSLQPIRAARLARKEQARERVRFAFFHDFAHFPPQPPAAWLRSQSALPAPAPVVHPAAREQAASATIAAATTRWLRRREQRAGATTAATPAQVATTTEECAAAPALEPSAPPVPATARRSGGRQQKHFRQRRQKEQGIFPWSGLMYEVTGEDGRTVQVGRTAFWVSPYCQDLRDEHGKTFWHDRIHSSPYVRDMEAGPDIAAATAP